MIVSAPMNESELRNLMYTAQLQKDKPFTIRYPRGQGVLVNWKTPFKKIKIGKGRKVSSGKDLAILTIGHIGNYASKAIIELNKIGINPSHYDMRFVKPLDSELLHKILRKYKYILTVEDGCLLGGFGSSIIEFMSDNNYKNYIKRLGIPDKIIEHGSQDQLYTECGYDKKAIIETCMKITDKTMIEELLL